MADKSLTIAERRCLRRMYEAGGSGVLGKYGKVTAGGEQLPFEAVTYLRLVGDGMLHFSEPRRLAVTLAGIELLAKE